MVDAEHESVAVPAEEVRLTLEGIVQPSPEGEDLESDRSTVPVNPFVGVMVTVDVPCDSTKTRDGTTGAADIVKSSTVKMRVLECGPAEPLVPVTVTE